MLRTILLALLLLVDSESRAHARAIVATNAPTGGRGVARRGGLREHVRERTSAPIAAADAAREGASPEAKRTLRRDTLLAIAGSAVVVGFAVLLLRVLS